MSHAPLRHRVAVMCLASIAACKGGEKKKADDPKPAEASAPAPADPPPAATPPPEAAPAPAAPSGPPATAEEAAQLIAAAFADDSKVDAAGVLLPASKKVTVKGGPDKKASFEGVAGLRDVISGGVSMKLSACKKGCCDFKPEHDDDRQLGRQPRQACFDDKLTLVSITIADES